MDEVPLVPGPLILTRSEDMYKFTFAPLNGTNVGMERKILKIWVGQDGTNGTPIQQNLDANALESSPFAGTPGDPVHAEVRYQSSGPNEPLSPTPLVFDGFLMNDQGNATPNVPGPLGLVFVST